MIVYYLGLLGVAVFAISGALAAGRRGLDWVGVLVLALVTSVGGGTIRDVLLNRETIFWIADTTYIWVVFAASVFTIIYVRFFKPPHNSLLFADALGLALFTILGAQIAEAEGASTLIVVIMAVLTGVAGGVIRDVLTNEVPLLFRSTETIYSVAALAGTLVYLLLQALGIDTTIASLVGIAFVAGLRFLAIIYKTKLPAFHVPKE
jgi:uncharacterized membrane protein YeiH